MIGEFDFDNLFNSEPDVVVPGVTWFIFIIFLIIMTLILMNLLVGFIFLFLFLLLICRELQSLLFLLERQTRERKVTARKLDTRPVEKKPSHLASSFSAAFVFEREGGWWGGIRLFCIGNVTLKNGLCNDLAPLSFSARKKAIDYRVCRGIH